MRTGYSTDKRVAQEEKSVPALRERRMTAARMSIYSPAFRMAHGSSEEKSDTSRLEDVLSSYFRHQKPDPAKLTPAVEFRWKRLETKSLLQGLIDGVIPCFLVNLVAPGTVDLRAVSAGAAPSVEEIRQNWSLCFSSAASIGCNLQCVDESAVVDGASEIPRLQLVWELVRYRILKRLHVSETPSISGLYPGKPVSHVAGKTPAQIVRKWIQRSLKAASNFVVPKHALLKLDTIVKDAEFICALANTATQQCHPGHLRPDATSAKQAIQLLNQLAPDTLQIGDFEAAAFAAEVWLAGICRTCLVLSAVEGPKTTERLRAASTKLQESIQAYSALHMEGTREERALCAWINSLKLNAHVSNLNRDVSDGLILLHVIERISPGSVDWGAVNLTPRNHFSRLENCNHVVSCGKKLGFSVVGLSGSNLAEGDRRGILALLWQAAQFHLLSIVSRNQKPLNESSALAIANRLLREKGHTDVVAESFRDRNVISGRFLIYLIDSVRSGLVHEDHIAAGVDSEQRSKNASYAISLARRCGFFIFAVAEDLVKPVPKMVFAFVAAVLAGVPSATNEGERQKS